MKPRSLCANLVVALALLLTGPWLHAQDGLTGALSRTTLASPVNLVLPRGSNVAVADFDNDHKPDGAVLFDASLLQGRRTFRIEVHFTGRENTDLTFESAETRLAITASDVNRDGTTDIVVEQAVTHKRLGVWLNDGRGGFRKVRVEDFPTEESCV